MKQPVPASTDSAYSFLKVGVGYVSNVLVAGRNYGVKQYGLIPTVEYNHKSGWYAGYSGSVLSKNQPAYAASALYTGFANGIGNNWWYDLAYSHTFFSSDSNNIINNSISGLLSYTKNWFLASVKYSFLFGEETAHEVIANIGGYWQKENMGFTDVIAFSPAIATVFGTTNVPFQKLTVAQYKLGTGESWQQFKARVAARRTNRRNSGTYTNEFGLMNVDITIPVSIAVKNLRCMLSYNYAIPVKLPSEETKPAAQGYFSLGVVYLIH